MSIENNVITLRLLKSEYAIYKFAPEFTLDDEVVCEFISVTRTSDELSVVAPEKTFLDYLKCENGWKIFKIDEVLDFNIIGIISKISTLLAEAQIGIFVVSTFNTDYILVKEENVKKAVEVLGLAGFIVSC